MLESAELSIFHGENNTKEELYNSPKRKRLKIKGGDAIQFSIKLISSCQNVSLYLNEEKISLTTNTDRTLFTSTLFDRLNENIGICEVTVIIEQTNFQLRALNFESLAIRSQGIRYIYSYLSQKGLSLIHI